MPPIRKRKKKMGEEKFKANGKNNEQKSEDEKIITENKNHDKKTENQDESWRDFG